MLCHLVFNSHMIVYRSYQKKIKCYKCDRCGPIAWSPKLRSRNVTLVRR